MLLVTNCNANALEDANRYKTFNTRSVKRASDDALTKAYEAYKTAMSESRAQHGGMFDRCRRRKEKILKEIEARQLARARSTAPSMLSMVPHSTTTIVNNFAGPVAGVACGEGASAVGQVNVFANDGPEAHRALAAKNKEHIQDVATTLRRKLKKKATRMRLPPQATSCEDPGAKCLVPVMKFSVEEHLQNPGYMKRMCAEGRAFALQFVTNNNVTSGKGGAASITIKGLSPSTTPAVVNAHLEQGNVTEESTEDDRTGSFTKCVQAHREGTYDTIIHLCHSSQLMLYYRYVSSRWSIPTWWCYPCVRDRRLHGYQRHDRNPRKVGGRRYRRCARWSSRTIQKRPWRLLWSTPRCTLGSGRGIHHLYLSSVHGGI